MNTLTVVIPCFNEEATLAVCVGRVLEIESANLQLEILIVDDCSVDNSANIAQALSEEHSQIKLLKHGTNQGKGAALRTGFANATGDYVAVQDADLEYDPQELIGLLGPLISNKADVVYGSRFLSGGAHRVLYFWHSMGNKFLTLCSNMMTDLNLTDMETCYKVFRRDVIQSLQLVENRFGIEPEITAKLAHQRLRIFEMGISYNGRTYDEGKKINWKDGFRALYCIFHYNAPFAPMPVQFLVYLFIGAIAALLNLAVFLGMHEAGYSINTSAVSAFFLAAISNYLLCTHLLFRRKVQWGAYAELGMYALVVCIVASIDLLVTQSLLAVGGSLVAAKLIATAVGLVFNFAGRKFLVFKEPGRKGWEPSYTAPEPADNNSVLYMKHEKMAETESNEFQNRKRSV